MLRGYWEEESDIANAILYGENLPKPNWRKIAEKFDVNYRRLLARKNGRGDRSSCGGSNKLLLPDQEAGLLAIIDQMEARGMRCRFRMIPSIANFILANAHNDPECPPPTVGKNWTTHFVARIPGLHTRISKPLSFDRKWAHDADAILKWYTVSRADPRPKSMVLY